MGVDPITATIVAGTQIGAMVASEKGRKEQKRAARRQENIRKRQVARDNMAQVRQARIAQSQVLQGAATSGTLSSSSAQGGYSAIGALTAGNMQFTNQIDSMNAQNARSIERINSYQGQANVLSGISNLALQGMSMMGPTSPSQLQNTGLVKGSQVSTTGNASGVATTAYTAPLPASPWG